MRGFPPAWQARHVKLVFLPHGGVSAVQMDRDAQGCFARVQLKRLETAAARLATATSWRSASSRASSAVHGSRTTIVRPAARVGPGTIDIQAPLEAHGSITTGLTAAVRHVREALLSMAKTVHSETAREVGRLWALSVLGRIWRATSNGGSETERLASIGSGRCCTSRRLGGSSTLSTNTLCQATRSPTRLLLKAASTILRL